MFIGVVEHIKIKNFTFVLVVYYVTLESDLPIYKPDLKLNSIRYDIRTEYVRNLSRFSLFWSLCKAVNI